MNIETLQEYCLSKPAAEETLPFGPNTLVYKVGGKVFLLVSLDAEPLRFNLKCDPDKAIELREQYDAVQPGFHMNKKHWNTVTADGSVRDAELKEWIDDSYALVAPKTAAKSSPKTAAKSSVKTAKKDTKNLQRNEPFLPFETPERGHHDLHSDERTGAGAPGGQPGPGIS